MPALASLLDKLNPNKESGKLLMFLNAIGMAFGAASNTFAAAKDKNTSPEDKKFLVPAGAATGVANIAIYIAMTKQIIKKLEKSAQNRVESLEPKKLQQEALKYVNKITKKGSDNMKAVLKNGENVTQKGIEIYMQDAKGAASVLGAFIGAVLGCSIMTPIIRDISAYITQKKMEKKNPHLQNAPYKPYFDPVHIHRPSALKKEYQPLSMKSYMDCAFKSRGMTI